MEAAEEIALPVFVPVPWSEEAEAFLLPACDGDVNTLSSWRAWCESGRAQLLGVYDDDAMVCAIVIGRDGDDAVIKAAGGHWQGGGLVETVLPILELGFARAGMKGVVIETFRRGLMAKITPTGYRPVHVAFRKVL